MKILCVGFLLLLINLNAYSSEWLLVHDSDTVSVYFDKSSIVLTGINSKKAWSKFEYKKDSSVWRKIFYLEDYECRGRRTYLKAAKLYSKSLIKGQPDVLSQKDHIDGEGKDVAPESITEDLFLSICQ